MGRGVRRVHAGEQSSCSTGARPGGEPRPQSFDPGRYRVSARWSPRQSSRHGACTCPQVLRRAPSAARAGASGNPVAIIPAHRPLSSSRTSRSQRPGSSPGRCLFQTTHRPASHTRRAFRVLPGGADGRQVAFSCATAAGFTHRSALRRVLWSKPCRWTQSRSIQTCSPA